jgi:hypothetical protein
MEARGDAHAVKRQGIVYQTPEFVDGFADFWMTTKNRKLAIRCRSRAFLFIAKASGLAARQSLLVALTQLEPDE